jgi:DNA recombination-dependent growth factor C
MPALKGSLTYSRFFVNGPLPTSFQEKFLKSIRLRSMKPLEPDDEVTERSGWCRLGEPMETELSFEDLFYNSYLNVGFRTDRWMIPGPLLRTKLREAESAYLQKRGRERLSRKEKTELKDLVSKKLRRQLAPVTRMTDVSWSLDEGIVRFFSHAPKQAAMLEGLFVKTFALKLVPEAPYTLAARLQPEPDLAPGWDALEPTDLAEEEGVT